VAGSKAQQGQVLRSGSSKHSICYPTTVAYQLGFAAWHLVGMRRKLYGWWQNEQRV